MRRNSLMYILLLLASLLLTTFAASDIYADLIDILSIPELLILLPTASRHDRGDGKSG